MVEKLLLLYIVGYIASNIISSLASMVEDLDWEKLFLVLYSIMAILLVLIVRGVI